ncbi:hypothetical protein [Streptomyces sp. NPDC052107]|uniref:hypothetical protein n=1 Tax=Streptomyces sp. NPDC052107 TaxID=3155632 RepID=UPI003415D7AE
MFGDDYVGVFDTCGDGVSVKAWVWISGKLIGAQRNGSGGEVYFDIPNVKANNSVGIKVCAQNGPNGTAGADKTSAQVADSIGGAARLARGDRRPHPSENWPHCPDDPGHGGRTRGSGAALTRSDVSTFPRRFQEWIKPSRCAGMPMRAKVETAANGGLAPGARRSVL